MITLLNLLLDVSLLLLFPLSFASAYLSKSIHPWVGGGMAAVVFIHQNLHWGWIKAIGQRILKPMTGKVRLKVILDALLLTDFLLLATSGLIVSVIYAPNMTHFHQNCMYVFAGLLLVHLSLNWKWLWSKLISFAPGGLRKMDKSLVRSTTTKI
ncbi:MAG: DUF4405 domain-containing protein [Chloroflexota bacterium]